MPFKQSRKHDEILAFIRQHEEIAQPEIVDHFKASYKNMQAARVCIGLILRKMEAKGSLRVSRTEFKARGGGIEMNYWEAV